MAARRIAEGAPEDVDPGLTVSVGGLAAPALGALADAMTLRSALFSLIALPALGRLLLCGLREPAPPGTAAGRRTHPRNVSAR
ncbi:hypothetical protein [Streptomyces sp. NPDC092370]|uniref:hypothetical protein n=1 Tax=Streptomyces sp. NPDC092370 TaxID=3366016 RepID=UPI00380A10A3